MQNNKVLAAIGYVTLLVAIAADYGLGKLPVAKPRPLPVQSFPTQVGEWQGGPLEAVDPEVQQKLPSARIVERLYTNMVTGQQVDLMLLTVTNNLDIHNPTSCFPSQGWHLSDVRKTQAAGDEANIMTATQDNKTLTVLYWLTGYYPPAPSRYPMVRKVSDFRTRLVGKREGMSLFVRMIAVGTPAGNQSLRGFANELHDPLQALTAEGAPTQSASAGNENMEPELGNQKLRLVH